jgi:hypothetical protein
MLNHAATVNAARGEERAEWKRKAKDRKAEADKLLDARDPIVENTGGKRLSECTSEQIAGQFRGM